MGGSKSKSKPEPEPEPEPEPYPEFDRPWRETIWSKEEKERLMNEIRNLTPRYKEVKKIKIMLAGQIGAGKSSYINTVDFMFQGQFSGPALAGEGGVSFTKKLAPYHFEAPFVIYDTMGIDINMKSSDEYVSAAKGHIEDEYVMEGLVKGKYLFQGVEITRQRFKFNPIYPLDDDSKYYNMNPTVNDRAHCLVYVVPADQQSIMNEHVLKLTKEIRKKVSDSDIPQVVLLTKVDEACPLVGNDLQKVYRSKYIKTQIERASKTLGIPVNCIFPVKNYSGEISLNDEIDVLSLTALLQILRFANGYLLRLDQKQHN